MENEPEVYVLNGQRNDTKVYYYDGHLYHKDDRCYETYRCKKRGNGCRAILRRIDGKWSEKGYHLDYKDSSALAKYDICWDLKDSLATNRFNPPQQIIDTALRQNPAGAHHISMNKLKRIVKEHRQEERRMKNWIPKAAKAISETLSSRNCDEVFRQGGKRKEGSDDRTAGINRTPEEREAHNDSQEMTQKYEDHYINYEYLDECFQAERFCAEEKGI